LNLESRNQSVTSLREVGAASSPTMEYPSPPSLFAVSRPLAISVTGATPPAVPDTRPRASSATDESRPRRDKSLPPPPRPPKKSHIPHPAPPPRSDSLGEVTQSGLESKERLGAGVKYAPQLLHGEAVQEVVRRSAPPTPPPKRRKAPAVPAGGRKGTTMTTIASSSSAPQVLEVPVVSPTRGIGEEVSTPSSVTLLRTVIQLERYQHTLRSSTSQ